MLIYASFLFDGDPYVMQITPSPEGGKIRFFQPSAKRVSPDFEMKYPFKFTYSIELTSSENVIPGGTIEFSDVSPLPGRFKIRIGDTLLDVMEQSIFVNDQVYGWNRQ